MQRCWNRRGDESETKNWKKTGLRRPCAVAVAIIVAIIVAIMALELEPAHGVELCARLHPFGDLHEIPPAPTLATPRSRCYVFFNMM
ncbi:MAG: hypothetical protein HYS06_12610 [Methylocystis sp.]|nr:hypothetical protein [Methylocystis sp.]